MESPITAWAVLAGSAVCAYQLATAGVPAWNEFFKLFDESRCVALLPSPCFSMLPGPSSQTFTHLALSGACWPDGSSQ